MSGTVRCRLCLSNESFVDIFDSSIDNSISLQEKIHTCLPIQVNPDDSFSTKLCNPCEESLNKFYDFWVTTVSSQKEIENLISVNKKARSVSKVPAENVVAQAVIEVNTKENTDLTPDLPPISTDSPTVKRHTHRKEDSPANICRDCGVHTKGLKLKSTSSNHSPCGVCHQPVNLDEIKSKEKKYECSVCDYSNNSLSNFKIHMMKHNGEHVVKCQLCDKGFYSRSLFEEHTLTKHSNRIATNHCSQCNNTYHSKAYLRQHLKTHSPNYEKASYQCETCGKTYLSWKGVKRHRMVAHQGQVYQCEVCDKEVKSLESLKNHQKIHRGEKSFVCAACGKAFRTRNGLTVHERTHTGVKPFKCQFCDRSFSQSSTLKIHVRYHKGDRPYHCTDCSKRYVTVTLLKKHQKTHKNKTSD